MSDLETYANTYKEIKNMKSCAFTGHRPQNLPFGFREDDERCTALNAAEIVLELKKTYPGITIESAIPCETQAAKWNAAMRERYYGIAAQCDKETLLQTHYTPDCMDKRNRYMVDHADYIIAVWDGKPSGTGKTVMYAQSKGKVIIKVNPATLTVERL